MTYKTIIIALLPFFAVVPFVVKKKLQASKARSIIIGFSLGVAFILFAYILFTLAGNNA